MLSPLTAFPDAAFNHCAQSLAPRDLAVVYALGPVSFLASLAACLALGTMITACRTRRRRLAAARRPPRRPPDRSKHTHKALNKSELLLSSPY